MHELVVKDLGIATYRENIAFLRFDSSVCVSEGFTALTRIEIIHGERMIIATLNTVHTDLLTRGEVSLSMEAMQRLGVKERDVVRVRHVRPVESFSRVRAKMYGNALIEYDYADIMVDIVAGRYSNIEMAAFISACSGDRLSNEEVIWLTKAMIACGNTLQWSSEVVHDKHCIGGLPGNRTTPIVVSIVAAAGLLIPKTSSRAITSPEIGRAHV